MKHQADKHRSERTFSVGDEVFLKLQPYVQSSVLTRANHKLSFKYFGPYRIVQHIGEVAYELALPENSRVHPVFHVSQLKPCVGPKHQVLTQLPAPDALFQVPVRVLQRRVRQRDLRTVVQVLVQWSGAPVDAATWEDLDSLKQRFPRASAWGQAEFQGGGMSTTVLHPATTKLQEAADQVSGARDRHKGRNHRAGWLVTTGPGQAQLPEGSESYLREETVPILVG